MKSKITYVVGAFGLIWSIIATAAIPFAFDPLTAADAGRPVRVALDGDVAAVIEVGLPYDGGGLSNNLTTYHRVSSTNWVPQAMLPAPGTALSVDIESCWMAVGKAGRIDVWNFSCGAVKPAWQRESVALLTNASFRVESVQIQDASRLAALARSGSGLGASYRVYVFDRDGATTNWIQRAEITMTNTGGGGIIIGDPASSIGAMSLRGSRLAVAAPAFNTIRIHEQNAGGAHAWGAVATVTNRPAGISSLGYSLALGDTRLAASGFNGFFASSVVLVYSNNTGGAGAWGLAGTLLAQPTNAPVLTLDTRGGILAVLGYNVPIADSGVDGPGAQAWIYGSGAGVGGWALERRVDAGPFRDSYWSVFFQNSAGTWPHPAITTNRLAIGLGDTSTTGLAAGWFVSVHQASAGGAGQWGVERVLSIPGRPRQFGESVAMHGAFLAVGMPGDDVSGTNSGSAYVWYRLDDTGLGSGWIPVARLRDVTGSPSNRFGAAVSVQDIGGGSARVAVGAPGEFGGKGGVHVFEVNLRSGQTKPGLRIAPLPYDEGLQFGASVAVTSNRLAAGAPGHSAGGAVYLFERDLGGADAWGVLRTNVAPTNGVGYGAIVDLLGDTLAVARPFSDGAGRRVFIHRRNTGGTNMWGVVATIEPPAGSPTGFAASIDLPSIGSVANLIAVGATGSATGMVYLMGTITSAVWEVFQAIPGPAGDGGSFGQSVAWVGYPNLAVGAPGAAGGGRIRMYGVTLSNATMMAAVSGSASDPLGRTLAGDSVYLAAGRSSNDVNGVDAGAVGLYRVGSYEIWAGLQPTNFVTQWLPWQDWDNDRDANLMEFAMGTDPMNPASTSRVDMAIARQGSSTYLGWLKPSLPYSTFMLDYNMQQSADLVSWGGASHINSITNSSFRLYPASAPWLHYRLNPRYPVLPDDEDGGIIVLD